MSAIGPKRTSLVALHMSAFGGKADARPPTGLRPQASIVAGRAFKDAPLLTGFVGRARQLSSVKNSPPV